MSGLSDQGPMQTLLRFAPTRLTRNMYEPVSALALKIN